MRLKGCKQSIDPSHEAVVDNPLIFQGFNLMLALPTLLMNLILLRAYEGSFVDIWVDFNVGVVAQLQSILYHPVALSAG
jgi:hypothetical protein